MQMWSVSSIWYDTYAVKMGKHVFIPHLLSNYYTFHIKSTHLLKYLLILFLIDIMLASNVRGCSALPWHCFSLLILCKRIILCWDDWILHPRFACIIKFCEEIFIRNLSKPVDAWNIDVKPNMVMVVFSF